MELPSIDFSYWILQTLAMMVTVFLIPRLRVHGPIPAFLTVLALAFINAHVWSAALFFEIPDSLTLRTLIVLLTNGLIFWLVVKILPGIEVQGLLPAIFAPVVFTICSLVLSEVDSRIDWPKVWKTGIQAVAEARQYLKESAPSDALQNASSP